MQTPSAHAAELRQAAEAERREWGGPLNERCFPTSSALHIALADWLDATSEHVGSYDCEAHCEPEGCGPTRRALALARLINGTCVCGKPSAHLSAAEDGQDWPCRVPEVTA